MIKIFSKTRKKEKIKKDDNIYQLLLPSFISICFLMICLCGTTWSWFTTTTSTNISSIKSASYSVNVVVIKDDNTYVQPVTENNVTTITFASVGTYQVTISPNGNTNNGYCKINFEDEEYYTDNLVSGSSLSFIVNVDTNENKILTITSNWGTCSNTPIISNESEIGTKPTSNASLIDDPLIEEGTSQDEETTDSEANDDIGEEIADKDTTTNDSLNENNGETSNDSDADIDKKDNEIDESNGETMGEANGTDDSTIKQEETSTTEPTSNTSGSDNGGSTSGSGVEETVSDDDKLDNTEE